MPDWRDSDPVLPTTEAMHRLVESEPFPANLGAFLRERAATRGHHMAFTFFEAPEDLADRALSYRALDARVARLAGALHDQGLRKGHHVGVMLPNGPAWPLAWLALARLGAVMVPINIRYTARELGYVLTDSDASWLVIHRDHVPLLDGLGDKRPPDKQTIVVGGDPGHCLGWDALIEGGPADFAPPQEPALADLMTIQYTSGTTGFPKGVMLSHRHWFSFAKIGTTELRHLGIGRVFLAHPFYYMAGQAIFLFALQLGASLSIAPQLSIRRFMGWVQETRGEYTLVTNAILKQALPPADSGNDLKFLHVSAAYAPEVQDAIESRFGCPVRNIYGMTENGIATYVPLAATAKLGPDCIGVPAPFRQVMIADENGRALADGEAGEICVRGPGILKGYYKKPDATAAAFFGDWHRSGDRGMRDSDGYFHFLGRIKDVIRRNNENISAVEIETVLLALDGVERAAAIPVPDERRGEEVKAYLVLNPGLTAKELPPETVIAHCAKNLAPFKVPRYLEYRTELPTTPSDKVEKQKLRAEKPDLRTGAYDREDRVWR